MRITGIFMVGESGGPEKRARFRLQTTAGRSRKQHSRTCDLPDIAVGLALREVAVRYLAVGYCSKSKP